MPRSQRGERWLRLGLLGVAAAVARGLAAARDRSVCGSEGPLRRVGGGRRRVGLEQWDRGEGRSRRVDGERRQSGRGGEG